MNDNLSGIREIKAFSQENKIATKIGKQIMTDCGGDKEKAALVLRQVSSFTGKNGVEKYVTSLHTLRSEKWAGKIWGNIKPNGREREKYDQIVREVTSGQVQDDTTDPWDEGESL